MKKMEKSEYDEPEDVLEQDDIIEPEDIELEKSKKVRELKDEEIAFEDSQEEYDDFKFDEEEEYLPLEENE